MSTAKVYEYIVAKAVAQETCTYQDIAEACGLPARGNQMSNVLSPMLSNIFLFCRIHDLPHLTVIVVRKSGTEVGLPGIGFWKVLQRTSTNPMFQELDRVSRHRKRVLTVQLQNAVFLRAAHDGFNPAVTNLNMDLLQMADEEEYLLERLVNDKLGQEPKLKPYGSSYEPASLERDQVDAILKEMHGKLATQFGITMVQDHNGAFGKLGERYVTLRFGDFEVSMSINSVTSHSEDVAHNNSIHEDK